jgi:hypothetical protein
MRADKSKVQEWREDRKERDAEQREEARQNGTIKVVGGVLATPALIGLVLYFAADSHGLEVLAVGLLTAAAAFAAGALLGFLFGIPRFLAQQGAAAVPGATDSPTYAPNTNLEQISDWLTKILVGVGLVEVGKIGHAISVLGNGVEEGLGENTHSIAIMLMISFSIVGFLSSYLFTRLRLQMVLEPFKVALKKQEEDLTTALPLVRAQLDPSGEKDPTLMELVKALYKASSGIRDEAFYLARNQRRANWRGVPPNEDKHLVDLAIPVFEALVGLDTDKEFHRNCGELGYALKDRASPSEGDYKAAVANLTEAIKRRDRDPLLRGRYPLYEFNRAFCNIKLDRRFAEGKPAEPELAAEIKQDLDVARASSDGRSAIVAESSTLNPWLSLNP